MRAKPPTLLSLARRGALGSISVHTDVSRPSYPSAFTTIGAGARVPDFDVALPTLSAAAPGQPLRSIEVTTRARLHDLSVQSGYGARPGALAGALETPVVAIERARSSQVSGADAWALLAAMEPSGRVAYAATGAALRSGAPRLGDAAPASRFEPLRAALALRCATVVIDASAFERATATGGSQVASRALMDTDRVLHGVSRLLDLRRDLLLVISPTSPPQVTHLGIAVAVGPGFPTGSLLESASTHRAGIVTLPDIAPTVLAHFGVPRPAAMSGQPMFSVAGSTGRLADAQALDREAVFVDGAKPTMSWVFLGVELALFVVALAALWANSKHRGETPSGWVGVAGPAALAVGSLPVATFLVNVIPVSGLGRGWFVVLILVVDACLVAVVLATRLSSLEGLGVVAAVSLFVMVTDLITGGHLQLNSVLGDSPLIAGRFAGAGNNAFAIMASTAVVIATLLVWRLGRGHVVMAGVAALFVLVVVVDGAPQFGSDIGGVLALVPGFALTWILLGGKRISLKLAAAVVVAAVVATGLFVALDVSRPPSQRTHLGRFFEDVRSRGGSAFFETIRRKASSNLRQLRSFQNLYRFLPAALITSLFLFWPIRWWRWLGSRQALLREGLIAGLAVAVIGSALNDSGITIFTTMLLFFAPLTILIRLRFTEPGLGSKEMERT